ncbi:MAG TPA: citramalate synthase [Dehalococcoidia bacterium]|nr:citramalate synthase [Dehalococcoidia bacterium]
MKVELYDTTLRDGTQMEGISLSVQDKLKIAQKLDELGVHYIEGGWPGSNPKDAEFFAAARSLKLRKAKIAAFGSTRRAGIAAGKDPNLRALVDAATPAVTLVGKANEMHVRQILETSLEENLAMIRDSIAYLKSRGLTVFFDAEHFFDGFRDNPEYTLDCLRAAADAGADCLVLCDTNGGVITPRIVEAVATARTLKAPVGIHAHNDADLAVANTLAAVQAGATHVQGTINGYGERCGNANLVSVIANLKLKMNIGCVSDGQLARLTEISRYVSEVANMVPDPQAPYVGVSAFTHKAGIHVAAVVKHQSSYQHIDPAHVGNEKRVLVSELAGYRNVMSKLKEQGVAFSLSNEDARRLLEQVKVMESQGYQYEGAEASFELLAHRSLPDYRPPFELRDFLVVIRRHSEPERGEAGEMLAEAAVKLRVDNETMHTVAEGDGPVNALDLAVRKALTEFHPDLQTVKLVDYKVRIVDSPSGTAAIVRVLLESTDGEHTWTTVGCSPNIIEASWLALSDSLEWWLTHRPKGESRGTLSSGGVQGVSP